MNQAARRNPRTERTRAALIAAGRRLFGERPMDAVSVDDIVQAAEVGKGSFYNHFADREALARAVSAEIRATVERVVGAANAEVQDPARRIARAVSLYFRFALDDPERARFLARVLGSHVNLASPLNQGLADDLTAGLAEGRIAVATLEGGMLYVMGVAQTTLARLVAEPSLGLAVGLSQQMNGLLLRGLGLAAAEADLIAAQAADEIVRRGAWAAQFAEAADG